MNHIYRVHFSTTTHAYVDIIATDENRASNMFWNEKYEESDVVSSNFVDMDTDYIEDRGPSEVQLSMFDEP